jgi:hypothetical protein
MENTTIRHRPRHLNYTLLRRLEIEPDITHTPLDQPAMAAKCPDCDCTMMYRGVGRLRSGRLVHYFECVHSHREVFSVSIVIPE